MNENDNLQQVTVSLRKSDVEKLDKWAADSHLRRSAVIRVMISQRWEKEQEAK